MLVHVSNTRFTAPYNKLVNDGTAMSVTDLLQSVTKKRNGGKRYEARSRGRSSPDTLAF